MPAAMASLEGHERYKTVKELNRGAFGCVHLALDMMSGTHVAIKFLERGPKIDANVMREIVNHRMLKHPHVIRFKEAFLTETHLALVMEYAERGDMYDYVSKRGRLSEDEARWIFQQVIIALDYLHRVGIACRDIKLENTLLTGKKADKPLVKLCDFGYAKHVDLHSIPNSRVGSLCYMAPEVLICKQYDGRVADLWSCGVMLFSMVVGDYPFMRHSDYKLSHAARQHLTIERITKMDYVIPDDLGLSPQCVDLIQKLLSLDPKKRITIEQMLQHRWFTHDLPPGALKMNLGLPTNITQQSLDEVQEIIEEARKRAPCQ